MRGTRDLSVMRITLDFNQYEFTQHLSYLSQMLLAHFVMRLIEKLAKYFNETLTFYFSHARYERSIGHAHHSGF